MGKATRISWTRSTINFWSGCTKVGPGCDGCYAEAFQRWIRGADPVTGEANNWGPGKPRVPHLAGAVKNLRHWNDQATSEQRFANVGFAGRMGFWPVFVNSHSDFFDNEVPEHWRDMAWGAIRQAPALTFLLLTKRIGNVRAMLPADWGQGWPHVWIGATLVNRPELERDWDKLAAVPTYRRWISHEPGLSALLLDRSHFRLGDRQLLHWVVTGGESDQPGHPARPYELECAEEFAAQRKWAGFSLHIKQTGNRPMLRGKPYPVLGEKGEALEAFPEHLRIREWPL